MKLEKRTGGEAPEIQEEPAPKGKKPVVVYIMILFIAAFLLMALSFFMHQRSNNEVLGELQNSVTAMQEIQATQDQVIDLQGQLKDAEKEAERLTKELEEAQAALAEKTAAADALTKLYLLQQHYAAGDYDGCKTIIAEMEAEKLTEQLPQTAEDGSTAPSARFQQLKEAVMSK